MTNLRIEVLGTPAPQGSKRHVGGGRMVESSKLVGPWREAVKAAVAAAYPGLEPITGPVVIDLIFRLRRPKSHYRTGRNAHLVRASAPRHPAVKPDLDKLVRSTLDGLVDAGVIADDALVTVLAATKTYADLPGARITVTQPPAGEVR